MLLLCGTATSTPLAYSLPQKSNDDIYNELHSKEDIIKSHPTSAILSGVGNDDNNYKDIGTSASFPSAGGMQAENSIIGSNTSTTTSTVNSNKKEITLVAEDAEVEIAPGKRVNNMDI